MKDRKIASLLDAGIIIFGLVLLVILVSGGIQLSIGDHTIGLRSYRNPLLLLIVFTSIRTWLYGKPFTQLASRLKGSEGVWILLFSVSIFILIYLASINIMAAAINQESLSFNLESAEEITPASSIAIQKGNLALKYSNEHIVEFLLPVGDVSKYNKIRLSFSKDKDRGGLRKLHIIYERSLDGARTGIAVIPISREKYVFEAPLMGNQFDTIRVKLESSPGDVNTEIIDVSLLSSEVSDYRGFTSVITVITGFVLLLPGLLIVSALTFRKQSVTVLFYSLFAASLVCFFLLYLLLELSFKLQVQEPGGLLLAAFLIIIASLVYLNYRRDQFASLNNYLYSARVPLFLFFTILLLLITYISYDSLLPFQNLGYQSISGPKTFQAFLAHDNYFQYANGRVIAENLPFSVEYEGRRLFYMAEDREILPGVIYAVFRSIYGAIAPFVGSSYMTFVILGVAMNLMVIFPIIALASRYFYIKSDAFIIALIFGNAVFIVQPSLTWFKFCGAALFLSAVLVLLRDRKYLHSWLLAGLIFGLAANMHAAVSIGIPLYFLWFVYLRGREVNFKPAIWLGGPALLVFIFMLINLPWKLVKKFYLRDSIDLFATFFFAGHKANNSLLDSAVLFFKSIPIHEQISHRLDSLIQAFRLGEISILTARLGEAGFEEFLLLWSQEEVRYTVFLYYPLLLLLAFSSVIKSNHFPASGTAVSGFPDRGRNIELKSLILIGLATHLMFIVAAFSYNHAPDVSWSQPYGVTILVYLGMILFVLQNRFLAGLLTLYVLFTYYRLYLAYMVIH